MSDEELEELYSKLRQYETRHNDLQLDAAIHASRDALRAAVLRDRELSGDEGDSPTQNVERGG